jgi:hypothetical protein
MCGMRKGAGHVMDEQDVIEIIDMMYSGDISTLEAMNLLDGFDGDLVEFL